MVIRLAAWAGNLIISVVDRWDASCVWCCAFGCLASGDILWHLISSRHDQIISSMSSNSFATLEEPSPETVLAVFCSLQCGCWDFLLAWVMRQVSSRGFCFSRMKISANEHKDRSPSSTKLAVNNSFSRWPLWIRVATIFECQTLLRSLSKVSWPSSYKSSLGHQKLLSQSLTTLEFMG